MSNEMRRGLTQEDVRRHLTYNPDTGEFTRAISSGGVLAGSKAGWFRGAYIAVMVRGKIYPAHRIAFIYMTGSYPDLIDHIDGDRTNNRWCNLRAATRMQNCQNSKRMRTNTSGVKNVSWSKRDKRWTVRIEFNGNKLRLGNYKDIELAELIAFEAREKYHGEFARHE